MFASVKPLKTCCSNLVAAYFAVFQQSRTICNLIHYRCVLCLYRQERQIEGRRDREKYGRRGRRWREHATECPKPLEQGIFLVDWAIHSRHVTLNFFHYKTLLPSPLQRQIACTYFTQWNIASPLKQSFSSQSCENFFETVISLWSQCTGYSPGFFFALLPTAQAHTLWRNMLFPNLIP